MERTSNELLTDLVPKDTTNVSTTAHQASGNIAAICRASVEIVRDSLTPTTKHTPRKHSATKRRTRHKACFSTEARIRQAHLHFYTMLLRLAFPKGRRRRSCNWSQHTFRTLLTKWIAQWTTYHAPLLAAMPHITDLPSPRHLLSLSFSDITEEHLVRQRNVVKRTLHGAHRTHMLRTNNEQLTKVTNAHQSKELGTVIRLLLAQPEHHCDLATIHSPTEGQITDHFRIHSLVTSFFADWYHTPPTLDNAARELTSTPNWWKTLLHINDSQTPQ